MIKERNWDQHLLDQKEDKKILTFEDFYLIKKIKNNKIEEAFVLGHNIIDLKKMNIIEMVFQKMPTEYYMKTHNINKDIYEYNTEFVYLVSIMTLESLQNFKYTENLNLLTMAFERESYALLFLSSLEDLRFNFWLENIKNLKESK